MTTWILSFAVFSLAFGGLAIGTLVGRRGIRGSCGGLNGTEGCGLCDGRDRERPKACRRRRDP